MIAEKCFNTKLLGIISIDFCIIIHLIVIRPDTTFKELPQPNKRTKAIFWEEEEEMSKF